MLVSCDTTKSESVIALMLFVDDQFNYERSTRQRYANTKDKKCNRNLL